MGKGDVVCPLMWSEEYAWSYMFFVKAVNFVLKPYTDNNLNRQVWEILSKASVKSRERTQSGVCVFSAYAMASRTVAN